jgi:hypothetical protein
MRGFSLHPGHAERTSPVSGRPYLWIFSMANIATQKHYHRDGFGRMSHADTMYSNAWNLWQS